MNTMNSVWTLNSCMYVCVLCMFYAYMSIVSSCTIYHIRISVCITIEVDVMCDNDIIRTSGDTKDYLTAGI